MPDYFFFFFFIIFFFSSLHTKPLLTTLTNAFVPQTEHQNTGMSQAVIWCTKCSDLKVWTSYSI